MSELVEKPEYLDFIREAVAEDLRTGRYKEVRTRFPPEPSSWSPAGRFFCPGPVPWSGQCRR